MKCVVIDDEFPARLLLERYISKIPYLQFLKSFKNPIAAGPFIQEHAVDLMFVDIQMPQMTGMEFLRSLDVKPQTILTTAYPGYALESYELDVIDYLVKPVSFERFKRAADKAYTRHRTEKYEHSYILLYADRKTYKVLYHDILFIEGAREYVIFHTSSGRIMTLEALRKLEKKLPEQFTRIHKSYIINKEKITVRHGLQALEICSKLIPVGKSYRNKVLEIFSYS